ncbi:MAG TPA: DUF4126 domain-containing protein [Terriglobales bacterium]
MHFDHTQMLAMLVAASFAAGLNVYATVATLGLLAHAGVFPLPANLHLLGNWWIIAAALGMFLIEFVGDKIPAFDLIWNALHTFIRVPVAALIAYHASSQLSPSAQMLSALLGGSVALLAHGSKTAVRAAVTPSPEPVSNIALSMGEDATAIGLTWFAARHPIWAAAITVVLLVAAILLIRVLWRAMKRFFVRAQESWRSLSPAPQPIANQNHP